MKQRPVFLAVVLALAGTLLCLCNMAADAADYEVGAGREFARVSDVPGRLMPGDTVTICTDLIEPFDLTESGRDGSPITVRGLVREADGLRVRPKVTFAAEGRQGLDIHGDWIVVTGLDISGALSDDFNSGCALRLHGSDLLITDCRFHHNRQAVYGNILSGNVTLEHCEFDSNGGVSSNGWLMHSVYLSSKVPAAQATVRYCWFHDGVGGAFFKTRMCRNVVEYSWFENWYYCAMNIISPLDPDQLDQVQTDSSTGFQPISYPMHSDILANVMIQGHSPGPHYAVLQVGGDQRDAPGTEGDFNIVHNLVITSRTSSADCEPPVAVLVHGNVETIRCYSNVFLEYGVGGCELLKRGTTWDGAPRTARFIKRHGGDDPVTVGAHNWFSLRTVGIPDAFQSCVRGCDPDFADLLNMDFRPRRGSKLRGAGQWPLPSGRVGSLVPEYEPQRGIAQGLQPTRRRAATPPSIGPFECDR